MRKKTISNPDKLDTLMELHVFCMKNTITVQSINMFHDTIDEQWKAVVCYHA